MAAGLPLIFESFEVLAAGASAGTGTTYDLTDPENITINNERVVSTVEDQQEIIDAFDRGFEIITYEMDILSDANVATDSTVVAAAQIILNGATGSVDITIDNVRLSAHRPFNDGLTRDHAMVMCSVRSTSEITVANA